MTDYAQMPVPTGHPVNLTIDYPQSNSRVLAIFSIPFFFLRSLLLIPAFFCLYFISIVAIIAVWFGYWGVAITGRYPRGLFDFVSGYMRWQTRASAYLFGLTDAYPPFRMSP